MWQGWWRCSYRTKPDEKQLGQSLFLPKANRTTGNKMLHYLWFVMQDQVNGPARNGYVHPQGVKVFAHFKVSNLGIQGQSWRQKTYSSRQHHNLRILKWISSTWRIQNATLYCTLAASECRQPEHFLKGERLMFRVLDGQYFGRVQSSPHSIQHRGRVAARHVLTQDVTKEIDHTVESRHRRALLSSLFSNWTQSRSRNSVLTCSEAKLHFVLQHVTDIEESAAQPE